ncbi:low molecular weight protein-tyrosine-phosphatase [Flaviflexus ciconiae]|uniref:low molecular weight protein-tyrosine-phosphatase n=1 Tax=Flaviflexus ciconiae TaxID=2496867 RepID=UPI001D195697|nr:low molecular weight protein-tyrosine-phosphatase [Flaviflexus ciconiae]
MRILIVCTGNICRSPMGEIVLREKLAQAGISAEVDSVGVSSEEHGRGVDTRAARVLREAGYDVPRRSARKVTSQDLEDSDLVLAMTVGHAKELGALAERHGISTDKIHLWREYDSSSSLGVAPGECLGKADTLLPKSLRIEATQTCTCPMANGTFQIRGTADKKASTTPLLLSRAVPTGLSRLSTERV